MPNLLYAERITILAGEASVGKTTFALEIADALTRTGKLWGNTVEVPRGRVLWLDFDHSWGRLQEIIDAYYDEGERELYTLVPEHLVPLEPQTLPAYRLAIERYGIDLIIADTAFDWLAVLDANDETEARARAVACCCCTTCGKWRATPPALMPCQVRIGGQPKWTRWLTCATTAVRVRIECALWW